MFALAATLLALFVVSTSATTSSVCTSTFTCYMFSSDAKSWYDADTHCKSLNAELVSVHSKEENDIVHSFQTSTHTWLGYSDRATEGTWVWSDGSSDDFTNWNFAEPNDANANKQEDCAEMLYYDGSWKDVDCGQTLKSYVCKK